MPRTTRHLLAAAWMAVLALAGAGCRTAAPRPAGEPVVRALRDMERGELWPGFRPESIPVAWFDGTRTVLLGHPAPPPGFAPGADGTYAFPGRHEAMRANTGGELGGVPTALVALDGGAPDPRARAALLMHERFHVYVRERHPRWIANELALLSYPVEVEGVLVERQAEVAALARAVTAGDAAGEACWVAEALRRRARRFALLSREAITYERTNELNEGLAAYVEHRALGQDRWDRAASLAPDDPRDVGYFTGHALGRLLDALRPAWRGELERDDQAVLDELLSEAVRAWGEVGACALDPGEEERFRIRARRIAAGIVAEREALRAQAIGREGWLVAIEAEEPLALEAFDPMNVRRISAIELVHTRWVKLGSASAAIEVFDATALTEGGGGHPFLNGVRALRMVSAVEPRIERDGDVVVLRLEHVTARLKGAVVERAGRGVTLRIPASSR